MADVYVYFSLFFIDASFTMLLKVSRSRDHKTESFLALIEAALGAL